MKILKTATRSTLTGKRTLTYQIGISPDSVVNLRISKNSGAGFFSDEWIALEDILATLKRLPKIYSLMALGSRDCPFHITPLSEGRLLEFMGLCH
jgi:hypothetical protein